MLIINFILLMTINNTFASESCPKTNEQILEADTRKAKLVLIKSGLENFVRGKETRGKSLSTLFLVNLEDKEQITTRKKELDDFLKSEPSFLKCQNQKTTELMNSINLLELEIAKIRLSFLDLPEKQRNALIALQKESLRNQSELESIRKVGEKAEEKIEAVEKAIKDAEDLSLTSESADLRELAAEIALIERSRKSIAETVAKLSHQMESLSDEYKGQTTELGKLSAVLGRSDASLLEINQAYLDVADKWRQVVDELVLTRDSTSLKTDISLPKEKQSLTAKIKNLDHKGKIEQYKEALDKVEAEFDALKTLRTKLSSLKRDQRYRELVITGQVRSQLMRMIEERGGNAPFKLSNDYVKDIIREIKLVPYRPKALLVSALNKVGETVSAGIEGFLDLFKSLVSLAFFILIPVCSVFLLKKLLTLIEESRKRQIRDRRRKAPSRILKWLHLATPYLPWIIMLLALNLSNSIVQDTEVDWLSEILPYFNYFFIYKIFRVFIDKNLFAINRLSQAQLDINIQSRIEKTSKNLGVFFLLSAYLLETTAAVARRALFYRLVWDSLLMLTPIVLAVAAYSWKDEILSALRNILSPNLYNRFSKHLNGYLSIFFILPAGIFLIFSLLFQKFKEELFEVDKIKSISAQLFRKKIESNLDSVKDLEQRELDNSYKDLFFSNPLTSPQYYVDPPSSLKQVNDIISEWASGESDIRSLAIYGEKGCGKSSLLNLIDSDCEIIRTSLDKKVTTEKGLLSFLRDECSIELKDIKTAHDDLYEFDASLRQKKLIIIDNAQNLFLSHRRGFKAYRLLSSLITLRTPNIFWCISFNYYSWMYLNAISNGSQFFRKVMKVTPWDDEQIKDLVLSRHKASGLQLEFNPVIYSLTSGNTTETFQYIQDRFFELLWEQSKGNPRTALALWLSSLTPLKSNKIRVGLPGANLPQRIDGLNEEELFVITAIARHENLTTKDAILVTGLEGNIVQHAVRIGIERGFLQRDDNGAYRITPIWQPIVIKELVGKNLLYG